MGIEPTTDIVCPTLDLKSRRPTRTCPLPFKRLIDRLFKVKKFVRIRCLGPPQEGIPIAKIIYPHFSGYLTGHGLVPVSRSIALFRRSGHNFKGMGLPLFSGESRKLKEDRRTGSSGDRKEITVIGPADLNTMLLDELSTEIGRLVDL